ncbi:MAG: hypothetical protein MUE90_13550 [Thermoanaerobaculales bacterium]|nr:hypothetical protein [Thermoanaerobaculales bacterium]
MKVRVCLAVVTIAFVAAPLLAQGPPVSSGPNVVRDEVYGWWWNFADEKRGYFAIIGADAVAICSGGFVGSFWDLQQNFPPADDGLIHVVLKGDDVLASVWPASILEGDACGYILSFPPIAQGTLDAIYNDNDLEGFYYDHNRHNSYRLSAHGVLSAPDGESMTFSGGFHCVFDPDYIKGECKTKIVLN